MTHMLVVKSTEGRDFDVFILAPVGMTAHEARPLADKIISEAKAELEDWDWKEIAERLVNAGFKEFSTWCYTKEEA